MKHAAVALVLGILVALAAPATAAEYSIRRHDDVIQLEDATSQIVVSVAPAAGNVVFEMKVKGQNVLRFPYGSLDEFRSRPALRMAWKPLQTPRISFSASRNLRRWSPRKTVS